ncbi:DUF4129 domain-containing protein [Agrilutibacter solisilvae]|uniref:DUF4129 domain-containing protein n=1 Tax=Agrilutibacter solisilvae TaxID=2763317 RepID=A0A974Y2A8_9GAMM|nr:DUF4129 domain-containing protein [Lysobacter solisilvae]QSX79280.1 DUF4129 domain-containing protein [Lysobacter solisilvae]
MRIEDLTVALRPRNPWEAVELGTALARRHLGAVLRPWLALSLPVLVLVNLLCWSLDVLWLAALLMWWLKPLFDRVPLFVLSRAVFGQPPGAMATLRAQFNWGLRWMPGYLVWRRLSPLRSLNLPIDLLEGSRGEQASTRRSALGAPVYGVACLLTLVFLNFEAVLLAGLLSGALIFVPNDVIVETAARMWNVFVSQPVWLQSLVNLAAWLVTTVLEPFYVGAGFGLYLSRRTQIEGWDIEMVLRRLRARLATAPVVLLAALGLAIGTLAAPAVHAAPAPEERAPVAAAAPAEPAAPRHHREATVQEVFGDETVRDAGWEQAVKRAYEDPQVSPTRPVKQWVPREQDAPPKPPSGDWAWLGKAMGLVGEYGMWVVFGVLALALLLTSPRWLRWMRGAVSREGREPSPVQVDAAAGEVVPLPADLPAAALRLWHEGRGRDALALMYRASVEDMARLANVVLVPGATEAHTLRASRRLPREHDREVFARAVRTWQTAAYAHGLPSAQEFDALLRALVHAFGWKTATGLDAPAAEGTA